MKFLHLRFASVRVRVLHREREKAKNQAADHAGEFHLEGARARNDITRGVGTGGIVTRRVGGAGGAIGAHVGADVVVSSAQGGVTGGVGAGGVVVFRVGGPGGTSGARVGADILVGGAQGGIARGRCASAGG